MPVQAWCTCRSGTRFLLDADRDSCRYLLEARGRWRRGRQDLPARPPVMTAACSGWALLRTAQQAVLSWALGVTLAGCREQAVQVVVDDGLGLPGRGLAAEDARAQARGHGKEADGFQVRVQAGGRVAGGLGRSQLRGDHAGHRG